MAFRIVVGYDGSDGAKAALDEAVGLAKQLSGKVLVTYAFGGPKQYSGAPLTPRKTLQEMGAQVLEEAVARLEKSGVAAEPILVDDNAYQGLMSVADQHDAMMIVVGTHGESLISAVLLGSTAYRLVHTSTKPVLVVPTRKAKESAI
jgi:nucleotide-binding universal stress UspA family protein